MYLMTVLVKNKRKLWGGVMHMGELSFPSKKIYKPRETFGILLSPKITPLLTKPFLAYYSLEISWAWTRGYKDNIWFLLDF